MPLCTLIWANLAPTWPQLGLQNPSKTGLKTMLKHNFLKSWFLQPLQCEMLVFASPRGSQNDQKCIQKQLVILVPVQLQKKHPPSFDFAPTWLPLGPPEAPPRGLQGLFKTTLGSILGHLGCKFNFFASLGVPPGQIFFNFWSKSVDFWSCFCSKNCFYSFY